MAGFPSAVNEKRDPDRSKRENTVVKNNQEVTSHPIPWRAEGGDAGRNEGGHARTRESGRHKHDVKQPHMPADAQDET